MEEFDDQVAVVTGASSGIGEAIALALADRGATVCLVGRTPERLRAVGAGKIKPAGRLLCYQADLLKKEDIRNLATQLQDNFNGIDVLVHSAGVIASGTIEKASVEDFDWQFGTNVRAPYALTKLALPLIRDRRGQIVFINSSVVKYPSSEAGQYAATKHALKAVADSVRRDVNRDGIRVLSMFVGRTATPMQAALYAGVSRPYHPDRLLQPSDVASVVVHALGLPRSAEVTDVHMRPLIQ